MKILIINENRHNLTGCIEKYTNELINFFYENNHIIHEFAFNLNPKLTEAFKLNKRATHINFVPKNSKPLNFYEKKQIKKILLPEVIEIFDDYDLVIDQTNFIKWPKKFYDSKKVVYVNHKYHKKHNLFFNKLMNLLKLKVPFLLFQNFIFLNEEDMNNLNQNKKPCWIIPPIDNLSKIRNDNDKDSLLLEIFSKNCLDLLSFFDNKLKNN